MNYRNLMAIRGVVYCALMFWVTAIAAEPDAQLVGKQLELKSGRSAEIKDALLGALLGGKSPNITQVTVAEATPRTIRLTLRLENFKNYTLLGSLQQTNGKPARYLSDVKVKVRSGETIDINFTLSEKTPEGTAFSSGYVIIVAQKYDKDIPGMEWTFRLNKNWALATRPENIIVRIRPTAQGTAKQLPMALAKNKKPVAPPKRVVKPIKLNPKFRFQTFRSTLTTAPATRQKSATLPTRISPVIMQPVKPLTTTTAKPKLRSTATISAGTVRMLSSNQLKLASSTSTLVAQLPTQKVGLIFKPGVRKEDKDRGARGPGTSSIDILSDVKSDLDVPVSEIISVRREVYLDKNPNSGVLYYIPRAYNLHWDADNGYGFKMLYAASNEASDSSRVLMAMRLNSGVGSRDAALVKDLVNAYKKRHPQLKVSVVRPLPITSEYPNVSLADSLGAHFNISNDDIVANVVSDALAQMNVSWATDEVTRENIKLVLSQDIGITGNISYTLESEDVSQVSIPANVNLAERGTFGTLLWKRGVSWRNQTPYPLRLKNLHALLIENNIPVIYSWDLNRTEVPPQARVEWDAREIPEWLDKRAKRIWLEYGVTQDCEICDRQVISALTFGASSASSRMDIVIKTLTPLEDTGAIEINVRLRSRYFSSATDNLQTLPAVAMDEDRSEKTGGKVYLVDRQPGEERPNDPLFEYQLELIMPDGSIHSSPPDRWISSDRARILIGRVQVEQSLGFLPGKK